MATHIASPRSTRTEASHLPQEDIGTVLDRFNQWAGQSTQPARELTREITYEEAVARSRRRVYADEDVVTPAPEQNPEQNPAKAVAQPLTEAQSHAPKSKSAQPRQASPKQATKGKSKMKTAAKPARATHKKAASQSQPKASPASTAATSAYNSILQATSEARSTSAPKTSTPPSPNSTEAYHSVLQATGKIISISESSTPAPPPSTTPSFEQALAAHIFRSVAAPLSAAAPITFNADTRPDTRPVAPLAADAPAVHLTVRLANEERDTVRERAHDLGITPAAYMRHCILEIDSLRAELESARLACARASANSTTSSDSFTLEGGSSLSLYRTSLPPSRPADGAWLTRLLRLVLPGKTKGQTLSTNA